MTQPRRRTFGARVLAVLRVLAPWVAVGCVVVALVPRAGELKGCLDRLGLGWVAFSFSLCMAYRFLNAGIWACILEALGHRIPCVSAMRAWLTSESLRWLPGSIWGFCSRVDAARNLGVPGIIASLSLPVELAITVGSWGLVALAGISASGLGARLFTAYENWLVSIAVSLLALSAGLTLGWPLLRRQRWFCTGLERLQAVLKLHLRTGLLIRAGLFYTALNAINGLGFWLILAGMGYPHVVSPVLAIGVNAAGWLIGFFALGVPGGIGVREAGAGLLLAPVLPWQEAALAAVLWRVVQIAAELASLLPWLFVGYGRAVHADGAFSKDHLLPKSSTL